MIALALALTLAMPADPIDPVAREITSSMGASPAYVVDAYCHVFRLAPRLWLADYSPAERPNARAAWTEVCRGR
jgi:hypothetical protein